MSLRFTLYTEQPQLCQSITSYEFIEFLKIKFNNIRAVTIPEVVYSYRKPYIVNANMGNRLASFPNLLHNFPISNFPDVLQIWDCKSGNRLV